MGRRHSSRMCAFAFAAMGTLLSALAACSGRTSQDQRELRIGLYDNPPKIHIDGRNRPAGLFVDLIEAVAREEGWQIRYQRCDWEDCLRRLENGGLDLMPDVAWTPDRATRMAFHDVPVTYSWSQAYRLPGTDVQGMTGLEGRRVAILSASIQATELAKVLAGLGVSWTPVYTATYDAAFAAVRDGDADVAVTNNFFGSRISRDYGLTETAVIFNPVSLFFAAPKGRHGDVLARIDHWLRYWQTQEGSVYFSAINRALAPEPMTVVPRWLLPSLVVAGVLIVLMGIFAAVLRWRVRVARAAASGAHARLVHVLETSPVVLALAVERDGELVAEWVSPNATRLFGFGAEEMSAPGFWMGRVYPDDLAPLTPALAHLKEHPALSREYRILDAGGAIRHVREELRVMPGRKDGPLRIIGTWTDLTAMRAQEAELDYLSQHDALTGLPNRTRLQIMLDESLRLGLPHWVLVVDIDRLRRINDTLGHAMGDEALRVAAQRLARLVPEDGMLARISGDEFAIVVPVAGPHPESSVDHVVHAVQGAFAAPLLAHEHMAVLAVSIGAARNPQHGDDAASLLKHAQLAAHEAKRRPHVPYLEFDTSLSEGATRRLVIDSALRVAMARREFTLHYQPQVDLQDGRLLGVEALLRWQHPELGRVPPDEFIPIAEENGQITEIGLWVLREAIRQLRAWDDAGIEVPMVAVNCSVRQLDPDRFPVQVQAVLGTARLDPSRLELEITESMLMQDPDRAMSVLNALKALGVRLAVDDFGTGYSNLAYLRQLPMTRLKIDRAFVNGIGQHGNDEQICRTVIALAHSLQLETLAEGVEHAHQAGFLMQAGCLLAQGYLYSPPLPVAALEAWIADGGVRCGRASAAPVGP